MNHSSKRYLSNPINSFVGTDLEEKIYSYNPINQLFNIFYSDKDTFNESAIEYVQEKGQMDFFQKVNAHFQEVYSGNINEHFSLIVDFINEQLYNEYHEFCDIDDISDYFDELIYNVTNLCWVVVKRNGMTLQLINTLFLFDTRFLKLKTYTEQQYMHILNSYKTFVDLATEQNPECEEFVQETIINSYHYFKPKFYSRRTSGLNSKVMNDTHQEKMNRAALYSNSTSTRGGKMKTACKKKRRNPNKNKSLKKHKR